MGEGNKWKNTRNTGWAEDGVARLVRRENWAGEEHKKTGNRAKDTTKT